MSTTMPSASSVRAAERRVDDERRAVQPLRRPEHLAAEAVGDHHVVADGHAEHGLPLAVGDRVAERRQAPVGQPGHHVGQLVEARLAGEQRVEGGVAQQVERERQPVGRRAARRAGRGDACRPGSSGCARRPEWNAPPSDSRTSASPYQLSSRTVPSGREQVERPLQPGGRRARVHDEVAAAGGVGRQREVDAERGRDVGPAGVDVDERDLARPGTGASSRATQQPTIPAPTTATRSPTSGAASHSALTAVSTVPASTARAGRHAVRHDRHGAGRHDVGGLVRVEAEHRAAAQLAAAPARRRRRSGSRT